MEDREIDAWIGEHLMGLKVMGVHYIVDGGSNGYLAPLPHFDSDRAQVFPMLDALRERGYVAMLYYGWAPYSEKPHGVTLEKLGGNSDGEKGVFGGSEQVHVFDANLNHAICLAVKQVLEAIPVRA